MDFDVFQLTFVLSWHYYVSKECRVINIDKHLATAAFRWPAYLSLTEFQICWLYQTLLAYMILQVHSIQ